ncbi:MAG: peptide deformylase [Candidatus Omnitrophica bacterium]|nr:peptide deformylase [Candidatus Omnitrophota bacterium]
MLMNRIELKLKVYPHEILRKKTKPIEKVDEQIRQILAEMVKVMYGHKGVGLAANQVGLDFSLLVADPGDKIYKLINPRIISKEGKQSMEEGCLSLPGICVQVKRAYSIKVEAMDENNRTIVFEAEGLLSRILQHEIDHLNGKLILDYAPFFKRIQFKRKFKKFKEGINNEGMCK